MGLILQIAGAMALVFRLWLCEFKLKKDLGGKRGHTSRFINYYFLIAMCLDFQNNLMTLLTIVTAPAMVMAFLFFDIPFYIQDCRRPMENKGWLIIERLTLHPPVFLYAVYFYAFQTRLFYFELFTIPNLIFSMFLVVIPMFFLDPRVTKKEDWPRGLFIVIGSVVDIIGNVWFYSDLALESNYPRFFDRIDLSGLFLP
ncbi:MAG: hypothetical protein ACTSVZ_09015 [Promethearchaeota archaeon]